MTAVMPLPFPGTLADSGLIPTARGSAATGATTMERQRAVDQTGGDRGREWHRQDDPDAPDNGPDDLYGDDLHRSHQQRVLTAGGEKDDQRQRRPDICEEERVDGRRDVRAADVH